MWAEGRALDWGQAWERLGDVCAPTAFWFIQLLCCFFLLYSPQSKSYPGKITVGFLFLMKLQRCVIYNILHVMLPPYSLLGACLCFCGLWKTQSALVLQHSAERCLGAVSHAPLPSSPKTGRFADATAASSLCARRPPLLFLLLALDTGDFVKNVSNKVKVI